MFKKLFHKSSSTSSDSIRLIDDSPSCNSLCICIGDRIDTTHNTLYTFEQVLSKEKSLKPSELKRYADLYKDSILELYHTTFNKYNQPMFKFNQLYKKLIDNIDDDTIYHLKLFKGVGFHKSDRPIVSFANRCEFRLMDQIILNYQKSFIEYIFTRLPRRIQYVLLTCFAPYFHPQQTVNMIALEEHFRNKYPNVKNLPFVVLINLTGNYQPVEILITNVERFEYNKDAQV